MFSPIVNNSNVKLRCSTEDTEVTAGTLSAGKDYRRLLSETKRLLLMSPTYSLTLAEIVEHFVTNGDPICTSAAELQHVLNTTQHNFTVWNDTGISLMIGISMGCVMSS